MMLPEKQVPKCHFYAIFSISIFTCFMAIMQTILIGSLGLHGFDNGTAITADCTNSAYFLSKFSEINITLRTCFMISICCSISSIILVMLMPPSVLKLCRDQPIYLSNAVERGLYVSCSVMIMTALVPAAHFLTFQRQLRHCTSSSYNRGHVLVVCIFGMILVIVGLILWIMLLWYFAKEIYSEEKYKQVISQPTEPNDQGRYHKRSERQKARRSEYKPEEKYRPHQETRQNMYKNQEKKPVSYVYSKEPQPQYYQPKYSPSRYESNQPKPVYQRKESPYKQEPIYQPTYNRHQPYKSRYTPEKGYTQQNKDAELVYYRKKKTPQSSKYDDALYKESRQYLSKQGGRSILNSQQAIQQREARGSDYFRSGDPQTRSPGSNKTGRQGMLLNYIRGKYAG